MVARSTPQYHQLLPGTIAMPASKSVGDFSRRLHLPPEPEQVHGEGKKPSSRVLTSKESLQMLQEKEDKKREREVEKEQRKS